MKKKIFFVFFFEFILTATAFCAPLCSFKGEADFKSKRFQIAFDLGDKKQIAMDFVKAQDKNFRLKINVDHLTTPLFDFSTVLDLVLQQVDSNGHGQAFYRGTLVSQYSLVDYKPASEIYGQFEIRDEKFILSSLSWGEMTFEGAIGIHPPHDIDLRIKFSELKISDFFMMIGCGKDSFSSSGLVDGQVKISGSVHHPLIKGRVQGSDGFIQDLVYHQLLLNFEGPYPVLTILDSMMTQSNGLSYKMEGLFDLTSSDRLSPKAWLTRLKVSPLIDESHIDREWTIKRNTTEGTAGSTELKYRLKKRDDANPSGKQESDILGIERRISF